MKILHIEDDFTYSYWLRENLEIFGVETVWYSSALAAIHHLEQNPHAYDLIIVDGSPGDLDGEVVVNEIRALTMSTPILTQSDSAEYIHKQFAAGSFGAIPRDKLKQDDFYKLDQIMRELIIRFKT
jgi:DNA-binding response OmpR family regulator